MPISVVRCESAEDLLHELDPNGPRFVTDYPEPYFGLFRGHADSEWRMSPSTMRPEKFLRKPNGDWRAITDPPTWTWREQVEMEFATFDAFLHYVGAQGLALPGEDAAFLRVIAQLSRGHELGQWPQENLVPALALAQHYGIPTRLLDWTYDAYTACWFAASGAAKKAKLPGDESGDLAVWFVPRDDLLLRPLFAPLPPGPCSPLVLVTVPPAHNTRLHAQGGTFLLYEPDRQDLSAAYEPWDYIAFLDHAGCPLLKFETPWAEAPKLLRLLERLGKSATNLYQGYEAAAASTKEMMYWDIYRLT